MMIQAVNNKNQSPNKNKNQSLNQNNRKNNLNHQNNLHQFQVNSKKNQTNRKK